MKNNVVLPMDETVFKRKIYIYGATECGAYVVRNIKEFADSLTNENGHMGGYF